MQQHGRQAGYWKIKGYSKGYSARSPVSALWQTAENQFVIFHAKSELIKTTLPPGDQTLVPSSRVLVEMLIMVFRCLFSFLVLFQCSLSIPFDYESSDTDLSPDYSSFFSDEDPGADSNLLALSPNDADPGTTYETNVDYSPSDNIDWFSPPNQADDIIISDSNAMCTLGKREDGQSCNSKPLPNLQLPDLPGTFGISDGSGDSTSPLGNPGADANAVPGSLTLPDPCLTTPPYLTHACCEGPEGTPNGVTYFMIENCALGNVYPWHHSTPWCFPRVTDTWWPRGSFLFSRPSYSSMPHADLSLLSHVIQDNEYGKSLAFNTSVR